ncbi:MAG: TonB-dependent hemoglobin/transferrin/lactoferrin family receptor [Gammaproteobacteria bacterium]|nr:TonB-dependent hemoglobin/transferrin/lactoferrin family receptor [Gammaproteobacteria bacterium]MDH5629765.1 TonB-dependent hemoglobin/transferrin/lactoferrin family receptor [Gammaproteobacteria bacterium]
MVKFRLNKAFAFFFVVSAAIFSLSVDADEDESELVVDDQVIVIIGKMPRAVDDVIGSASVIGQDRLDYHMPQNLTDLVRYEMGFDVEYSGTRFGETGLSIRGIGGNRVAMEVDGIPVADQFDIGSYSNSGRNMVDLELLQQVEILRGPASSIYGSDAIGGVVSFISKSPNDLLRQTDKEYYLGVKQGYFSADSSRLTSVHNAFASGKFSMLMSLSNREGYEMQHSADSLVEDDNQINQQTSQMFHGVYDINSRQQIGIRYQKVNHQAETDILSIIGLGRFASTTSLFGDDESESSGYSVNYEFEAQDSWLSGGVIRVYNQTTETTQFSDENRVVRGVPYHYDRDFFYQQEVNGLRLNLYHHFGLGSWEHELGYGAEWSNSNVREMRNALQTNLLDSTSTNIILSEDFPLRDFPVSDIKEQGIYINDQITLGDSQFTLIPAIRFDSYDLSPKVDDIYLQDNPATTPVSIRESRWSPKLGLQYQFSKSSQLYLQYLRGFRAPPFEDANIGLDIPLFNIRAIPNPDLKSETSSGYELGYRLNNENHKLSWIAFYNEFDDFIQTKVNLGFDPLSGRVIFQSQNLDKATIYGSEINYQYKINENWKWMTQAFWSKGENQETGLPLNTIEPAQIMTALEWHQGDFRSSLNVSHVQAKDELDEPVGQSLFKAPAYSVMDLFAQYQINDTTKISAAIHNLTDKTFWNWSAVNGLQSDDPLIGLLSDPGRRASVQFYIHW